MSKAEQMDRIKNAPGFIAALDQSGGSTPKALKLYGVDDSAWSNDEEMFAVVHQMRTRIITSPAFNGERILAAILFENTMDRDIEGQPTADYLWSVKNVVPILKVDKGLADEDDGVQVMKPMPDLDALLARGKQAGIFGTKMRSVIKRADPAGVKAVVDQQFEIGRRIVAAGMVPIIEPEVDIHSPEKAETEALLRTAMIEQLDAQHGNPRPSRRIDALNLLDLRQMLLERLDHQALNGFSVSAGKGRAGWMWWSEWRGAFSIIAPESQGAAFHACCGPTASARPSGPMVRRSP